MLNIVASFFRPTIPPSKDDVLQRKIRTKQKYFSLHGNSVPLFFETIHRVAMTVENPMEIKRRGLCNNQGYEQWRAESPTGIQPRATPWGGKG